MSKKITITIGIPAYNEEKNIGKLLFSILSQKENEYIIEKIIIISDGSIDQTVKNINDIKDKRITLFINKKRMGQIFCQNSIFSMADTDIVILLEADTYLSSRNYISNLISSFKGKDMGLVQGIMKSLRDKTLIGKTLELHFNIYSGIIFENPLRNPIPSGRGGRAFSRKVYKKLKWPLCVPEDEYAYLWCISQGIKTKLDKTAVCNFQLPQTFKDYVKEMQKNRSASISIRKYFSTKQIEKAMYLTSKEKALILLNLFIKNPMLCAIYIFIKMKANSELVNKEFSDI